MPNKARLLLVRHGRSAHVHDGSWIDQAAARRFVTAYDAASIRADDAPPPELMAIAQEADTLMASDLPRAIASVRCLARGREPQISPLLRELSFDIPAWGPRLPLDLWDGLFHVMWTGRLMARVDTAEMRRARDAAAWVDARCATVSLGVVVTHGGFRRLLSHELVGRGWTKRGLWHPYHNWSAWTLEKSG
jgi:broad specificity phosphatase PhoE